MQKAGLRRVIVLPAADPASELAILADAAASHLIEPGAPEDVAGRTTSRILDRIGELPGRSMVQLLGVSRATYFQYDPAEMIRAMAMRFRGQTFPIYAPLLLADAALVASLREQIGIADSIAQFQKLTRVLFSVGGWKRDGSGVFENFDENARPRARGRRDGRNPRAHPRCGRAAHLSLPVRALPDDLYEDFILAPDRVAVGGHARADAVLACVCAKAATAQVRDAKTAQYVLDALL